MGDHILVEKRDGVATVTFNRPDQRNAINYHGWLELQRISSDLEHDDDVKVVVFTGAGETAFSAGADIKDFEAYRENSAKAKVYSDAFDGAMDAVEALPKPTISMIKGFCVGGGCEFSMATDFRIAADGSRFGIPVAKLGILVGYGEMRRLVNLVGPGNASYILLSARLLDAQEALRIGLVNRVMSPEEIQEHTYKLAHEMATLAPLSHQRIIYPVERSTSRCTGSLTHWPGEPGDVARGNSGAHLQAGA
jgi:enoyl-CoA hydratase